MSCIEIHSWTFVDLVGSYLDLSIAFLLLSVSSLTYLTTKFLRIFGLRLPCPCNGVFRHRNGNNCLLTDRPSEIITAVHSSVKNRLPFDSREFRKEAKGKRFVGRKSIFGLRRRRIVKSSVALYEPVQSDPQVESVSPTRFIGIGNDCADKSQVTVNSEDKDVLDYVSFDRTSSEIDELGKKNNYRDVNDPSFDGNVEDTRDLAQALEEERAARAEVFLELEKERNAAASAADEAMAMILRLQEEKGSIEIEAKQYQRMIEEKSAYDAEEMNILKEILLRREKEKFYLEKEVEAYREMFLGNDEQIESDTQDAVHELRRRTSSNFSHQEFENVDFLTDNSQENTLTFGEELMVPGFDNDNDTDSLESSEIQKSPVIENDLQQSSEVTGNNSLDKSPIYDVHVIDDNVNLGNGVGENQTEQPRENLSQHLSGSFSGPNMSRIKPRLGRLRSSADMLIGLPSRLRGKTNFKDFRRYSMSSADYERYKIDDEVGRLSERLKVVQERREKLSLSVEQREKERARSNLFDEMSNQIPEIRRLADSWKVTRYTSLPSSSSKVDRTYKETTREMVE